MKKLKAAERRAQIINVSRKLFSEKGFNGTTTREIAEASGVSETVIFQHFASKRELYSAIIDERIQEVGPPISDEAIRARDDAAVFGHYARSLLQRTAEDPTLLRLLYFSALEGHELSDIFYSTHEIKKVMKFVDYIKLRVEEGAFRQLDPVLVARAFTGMFYTYITSEYLFSSTKYYSSRSIDQVVDNFLTVFLHGVVKAS
ncbi:MAG: TetR/AcrR family transcriptional regulator [Acidobacteriota bacterium]